MPNWTWNRMDVTGPADELAALRRRLTGADLVADEVAAVVAAVSSGSDAVDAALIEEFTPNTVLTFEAHVPDPFGTVDDWYNARLACWGVKWDASATKLVERDAEGNQTTDVGALASLLYRFDTPWSPPVVWFTAFVHSEAHLGITLWSVEESEGYLGSWHSPAGSTDVIHTSELPDSFDYQKEFGWYPAEWDPEGWNADGTPK